MTIANDNEKALHNRIVIDIDNDRRYDDDIIGLSQSDMVVTFAGVVIRVTEGEYIYTITENYENGLPDHILAEGYVIASPYSDLPYKFCCKLQGDIVYVTDV